MAVSHGADDRLLVLVKLKSGAAAPAYIVPRATIDAQILTAEIMAGDLARIDGDPAVDSVSISRRLPAIA